MSAAESRIVSSERELSISVSYGDARVEFSGSPEVVMRSLHEFVSKVVPNMDLARTITVNYSLNDLIQMFKDYVRITPEGPRVWTQDRKRSDRDVILLQLVAARIASLSGKSSSEAMSVGEIEAATGLYPKTISSRLSELTKSALVERVDTQGGGKYRIATVGINRLGEQLSKKLKPQQEGAV
jgi:DNA-binding transcriptional ArsR family regulator